jgi:hypothetical protein
MRQENEASMVRGHDLEPSPTGKAQQSPGLPAEDEDRARQKAQHPRLVVVENVEPEGKHPQVLIDGEPEK